MIAGGFVFSPEKVLYALVGAFVTRMTMEFILVKNKGSKVAYIISSLEYENRISTSILHQLDRGVTKITGSGGYTKNNYNDCT
ncbi:hypothetical protein ASG81_24190 [Paenibacillus sp. Soil522]|nr:hypothetical protein ASG81_24190 [Paenibacillus sp. Soil522]